MRPHCYGTDTDPKEPPGSPLGGLMCWPHVPVNQTGSSQSTREYLGEGPPAPPHSEHLDKGAAQKERSQFYRYRTLKDGPNNATTSEGQRATETDQRFSSAEATCQHRTRTLIR